jgi:hypothetical protein
MKRFLIIALLLMVVSPPPPGYYALNSVPVPWRINCTNAWAWDGFIAPDLDYCVPGILSQNTLNARFPRDFYGSLSSYAPGVMEEMEDHMGVTRGRGVALTTCGMMGYTVWLRISGESWRGPFTVVDCGAPAHTFYHIAVMGLAAEIGYETGRIWVSAANRVDIHIGSYPS